MRPSPAAAERPGISPKPDIAGLLSMLAYEFTPWEAAQGGLLAPVKQREEAGRRRKVSRYGTTIA